MDRITLADACTLLGVSRPTLNKYRDEHKLSQVQSRGQIYLSKTELIERILVPAHVTEPKIALTIYSHDQISMLQPYPGVYDLRDVRAIDATGVLALLCSIKADLKANENSSVHLLVDGSALCSDLESIGFFTEVERAHRGRVFFCNQTAMQKKHQTRTAIILPLHLIGYRGAEKKVLDELYDHLLKQGFSENYCGRIGWVVGELCDNAHTHSEGACYLVIESLSHGNTAIRFLCISIGDIGIGIPASLQTNPKYRSLPPRSLLPLSFKSEVSRMEVEPKRGKGLNDVVAISKGNQSWLKVECGNLALSFNFKNQQNEMEFVPSTSDAPGTRFNFVLIDSAFADIPRAEIDQLMQKFIDEER